MNSALLCDATETEQRRMTHFEKTSTNRPYGTRGVLFLFSRHFVPGYPRFNPPGINASRHPLPLRKLTLMGAAPQEKNKHTDALKARDNYVIDAHRFVRP